MTTPKGTYRKRRKTSLGGIPKPIQEWFSGERRITVYAYSWPYQGKLEGWWKAWQREHPGAVMPAALPVLIEGARKTLRLKELQRMQRAAPDARG